jgi:hypothetical protein
MKYTVEVVSGAMIYILSFRKIDAKVDRWDTKIQRHTDSKVIS